MDLSYTVLALLLGGSHSPITFFWSFFQHNSVPDTYVCFVVKHLELFEHRNFKTEISKNNLRMSAKASMEGVMGPPCAKIFFSFLHWDL